MHTRTQVIIVVILVVLAAAGAAAYFMVGMRQETEKIDSMKKEIEIISNERLTVMNQIEEIKQEEKVLNSELREYTAKIEEFGDEHSSLTTERNNFIQALSEKEKILSDLNDELVYLANEETALERDLDKAKADYQEALDEIESARAEKAMLEEKIQSRGGPAGGVELKKIVVKMAPAKEGRVIEINKEYNFAIINLGEKDDVKSGETLKIYRRDSLIAEAVIENVYDDMSSVILFDDFSDIQLVTGDIVIITTQ